MVAGKLFGATEALLHAIGFHLYPVDHHEYGRNLASAQTVLNGADWVEALSEGAVMSLEQAVNMALNER